MSNGYDDPTTQPIAPPQHPGEMQPSEQLPPTGGKAIASLVLGICSLLCWLCPIVGLPVSITGLALGISSYKNQPRTMTIVGIILSAIGLLLTRVNAAIGAYLGATGQHPLINNMGVNPTPQP